jgi:cell division initiation protein
MELTPQVFRDVQFREKLRGGYHPEDVDEFLEEAARAAEEVEGRLKAALERAERAERALEEASASDETLKRVLVMAQRTADETVREARDEAERLLAEARLQAQAIVADAEERGRRAYDSKLVEARASLERTEEALRQAQSDAETLTRWCEDSKAQLVQALREAADSLDKAGRGEAPPLSRLPRREPASDQQEQVGGGEVPPPIYLEGRDPSGEQRAGEWDPRFLEDLDEAKHGDPAGQGPVAPGPAAGLSLPGGSLGEDTASGGRVPISAAGADAKSSVDDSTVAFDEEALDSFFRDQDLHLKGPGRFRRRS